MEPAAAVRQLRALVSHRFGPEHWQPIPGAPGCTYQPEVVESSCVDGGRGVVLRTDPGGCALPPAAVVGVYIGLARLHPPLLLGASGEVEVAVLPPLGLTEYGTQYVLNRFWGTIDGAPGTLIGTTHENCELLSEKPRSHAPYEVDCLSGWAVGNRINHPPAGTRPNVHPVDAFAALPSVPAELFAELHPRLLLQEHELAQLPSRWPEGRLHYQLPGEEPVLLHPSAPLPLLTMVTTDEVQDGQEFFYDYKLEAEPGYALPEWYTPVA